MESTGPWVLRARFRAARAHLVVVAVGLLLGSVLGPVGLAPSVSAGEPTPKRCQEGFLRASPPKQDALCPTADSPEAAAVSADALPTGFQESVIWSGLTNPMALRFAADGRVFVAEKSGNIKIFDSLTDTTPTTFSDLVPKVHNFWDRGLLGMALDPTIAGGPGGTGSFLYVLYAYDHVLGSDPNAFPRWGDQCLGQPNGPGATTDGCVISGRLSRFPVSGSSISGPEQPLIEDWCQQFPSHSQGSLVFGPDGALYVTGGDGASFNVVDYGQLGGTTTPLFTQKNPCADPPNNTMTPPTAEGGALRSQDLRTIAVGTGYLDAVLGSNPAAYWRLGEASGTVADDRIGSANGTYVNTPTLGVAGAIADGTAVTLARASAEHVDVGAMPGGSTVGASVEMWVDLTAMVDGDNYVLFSWGPEGSAGSHTLRYSRLGPTDHLVYWRFSDGANQNNQWIDTNTHVLTGGWHHLVVTHDYVAKNYKVYIDGALFGTKDLSALGTVVSPAAGLNGRIGGYVANTLSETNGSIDEVAVYPRALTLTEIAAHYAARTGGGGGGGDPVSLDGTVLRVNPATGAGMPGNPFASNPDPNAQRIIAYGLRNPFRAAFRPGTNELWFGDVGWNTWEELNRIPDATDGVAENFGWPCYEGSARQSGYDGTNLAICESLYSQGPIATPYYAYNHSAKVAGEVCPTGGSSITGVAFYPEAGGSYPASFNGGVFFADHTRKCIWFMPKGTNGQPNAAAIQAFVDPAANPVDLVIGPGNDLFYVDFGGGTIRRVTFASSNQPPTAVIVANPTSGPAPLTVQFSGSGSSDPENGVLTYAWDLDGDGLYDDATGVSAASTYSSPGTITVGLRVTDVGSATGTDTQLITVGSSAPVPVISTPAAGATWRVGDTISFGGSATDPQDGSVPESGLSWTAALVHCPSNCHTHPPFFTLNGQDSGTFAAPDHDFPASIEITLTATDSGGTSASVTRTIAAQGVALTFQTSPPGLLLTVNAASNVAPFTRNVIIGSGNEVTATSPQTVNGVGYVFTGWSDGGGQSHTITAPAMATTYTATFAPTSLTFTPVADAHIRSNQATKNFGTATNLRLKLSDYRSYLKFTVAGLSGPATNARLRLWVAEGGTSGGSIYSVANTTWTETGITWNNAPAISGSPIATLGTVTTGTWVEINLGTLITGNGTYTLAISNGNTNQVDYASRESANDPQLIVTP